MVIWIAVAAVALISTAYLLLPLRAPLAGGEEDAIAEDSLQAARDFYKQQLAELKADLEAAKLGDEEFESAKLELDRELLQQSKAVSVRADAVARPTLLIGVTVPIILIIAGVTYFSIGNPELDNAPLADRIERGENIDLADAITKIEKRLFDVPDDLQGWKVVAPIYMRQQAFDKAALAFRNIIRLEGESANNLTDLAEAVVLEQEGNAQGEPIELLQRALVIEPNHLRAQFYLAGEATRTGDNQTAIRLWSSILTDVVGDEPWLPTAREGLRVAQENFQAQVGTEGGPTQEQVDQAMQMSEADRSAMIEDMVSGLEERLMSAGGSPEEWQRLLRARLVQGNTESAEKALSGARDDLKDNTEQLAQFEKLAANDIAQIEKLKE
ncbi:c-type cytochrome biogenesis protein CcmI [Maritalea porphyrae]|uniref:C-type cytochrome biogenesis protein CcmI n=1 Tax=Maritalea porphyrae TaxID=880732 RepID=A0ABQ5UST5_9HYPH|nr:c-type cytochrome biogenesis protein CcmI [Maritalea porphyrae]GLQ17964.1 c-type cytochrome biogenesis protein CcmI [Maritalea porphyrae]